MYSMQGAVLAQAPVPWDTRAPAQDNGQIAQGYGCVPIQKAAARACSEHSRVASKVHKAEILQA